MKRKFMFTILLILLSLLTLAFAGCTDKEEGTGNPGQSQPAENGGNGEAGGAGLENDPEGEAARPDTAAYTYEGGVIRLKAYDAALDAVNDYEYKIPQGEETTLYTVLDAYNEVYVIPVLESQGIRANSITLEDGLLAVDCDQSIYGNYGSGTELHLLRNLFYAFFENIPEIENITISVDGKAYESGHIMYELGEKISRDSVYQEG